nr:DUF4214 domain-containing protein [uncultured Rhodopila sp.]
MASTTTTNPYISTIDTYYTTILGRTASAAEAGYWADAVNSKAITIDQARAAIIASPEAQYDVAPIVALYQAALGRVPDQAGLAYWVSQLDKAGPAGSAAYTTALSKIATGITNSAEFATKWGTSTVTTVNPAFITELYVNILGRAPDTAGLSYWVNSGLTPAQVLLGFTQSAEFAKDFGAATNAFLNQAALGTETYTGGLTSVTSGQTIALATGPDNPTLAANETVTGLVDGTTPANSTLTAADTITGVSGGYDTLSITTTGAPPAAGVTNGALVSNIATVDIRNTLATGAGTDTLDASTITGLTAVYSYLSSGDVTVNKLAAGAAVGLTGNGTLVNGALAAQYGAAATAATVNLSGGTVGGSDPVQVTGLTGALTSATVNSTGAANTIDGLALANNTITSVVINASTGLDLTDAGNTPGGISDTKLKTITVSGTATNATSGTAAVDLGALGAAVTTVTASGLTNGGVSATGDAALTSFTGGAGGGNTLDLGAIAGVTTLNGGGGTNNTLGTTDTALNAAELAGVAAATGFQTLAFNGASATVDQTALTAANSTITKLQFDVAGAVAVANATAGNISLVGATGVNLNAATGVHTLNASLDGSSTIPVALAGITVANASTLNLASNGSFSTGNSVANVSLTDNSTLNITGSQALSLTVTDQLVGATAGETINASAFTGKLTLLASGEPETITTGSGGSAITLGANINSVTLGTGADKLTFTGGSTVAGTTDTVTAFNAANDTFTGFAAAGATVDTFSGKGTGTLLTDLNTAAGSKFIAGDVAVVTLTGGSDAGTWLVATPAAGAAVGTDFAVQLNTLTGTLTTHNFV